MTITGNYEKNEINQYNDHGMMDIEIGINHCNTFFLNYYRYSYHFIC